MLRSIKMNKPLLVVEKLILDFSAGRGDIAKDRKECRSAIQSIASVEQNTKLSLSETIEFIYENSNTTNRRVLAAAILRISACEGFLIASGSSRPDRQIVEIIERGYGKLVSDLFNKQHQTHQKLIILHQFHSDICQTLSLLTQNISSLQDLNGRRQTLQRELNKGL